jgi:hypothetical protein
MFYGVVFSLHPKDTTEMEWFCWPDYGAASCISNCPSQQGINTVPMVNLN